MRAGTNGIVAIKENIDGTGLARTSVTTVQKNINDFDLYLLRLKRRTTQADSDKIEITIMQEKRRGKCNS